MSYSDEPNLVPEKKRSKKPYFLAVGLLVFIALLLSVAFFPQITELRARLAEVGPHGGTVHRISLDGQKFTMEIVRTAEYDYHTGIFLKPVGDASWDPAAHTVQLKIGDDSEAEDLAWNEVEDYFGLSQHRIYPAINIEMDIRVLRDDQVLWSGTKWSYRLTPASNGSGEHGGHAH